MEFKEAIRLDPTYLPAYSFLGFALLRDGKASDSVSPLEKALMLDPHYTPAHFNLANSLLQIGRTEEALDHLRAVLNDTPTDPEALKNMAWVLSTSPDSRFRDGLKAVGLAETASRLTDQRDPMVEATLAAAYAEAGMLSSAVATANNALQLTNVTGLEAVRQLLEAERSRFLAGQPFRDNR